ncbi:SEL1-like repeat protein [Acidithiobacillus concretivorus]|uniref:Sel1 repeat family protein n=1 Tax=Acidithiobacillus concretivorus TaxID=3063952 RepID=A0ABS5ZQ80_9PROT|nr:SEL1-like repeat protein [Acidithiobacillus concretivorus]MBU2738672.1 sel1 repeat family protein [Acidithiobacillus concretivorus]
MKKSTLMVLILLICPLAAAAQDLESLRNQAESDPAALAQLQALARGHDAKAAFYLGTLYSPLITRKEVTVHKGWPETLHWYRKAAGLGLARADFDLGLAYEEGLGVGKNPQQAKTYFTRMAHIAQLETALPASAQLPANPQESARQD